MSWTNSQFLPPQDFIDAVVLEAVCPVLVAIERDTGIVAHLSLQTVVYEDFTAPRIIGPLGYIDTAQGESAGEARLWFRKTFTPLRALYYVEAVIRAVRPESQYSGFNLRGSAKRIDNGSVLVTLPESVVSKYRDWSWRGPR